MPNINILYKKNKLIFKECEKRSSTRDLHNLYQP